MVRLTINPPRLGGPQHGGSQSHGVDDILPNQPVRAHLTSSPLDHPSTSTKPTLPNIYPSSSQFSSRIDSSIAAPSGRIEGIQPVDVIRGTYIPDQDRVIIANWSAQVRRRPDLVSSFEFEVLQNQELHTLSAPSGFSMARPSTRFQARESLPAGSTTQTVPQKRKRAAPKSKKESKSPSLVQTDDLQAMTQNGVSTSPVTDNGSVSDASSKPKIIWRSKEPGTPGPNMEISKSQSMSPDMPSDLQCLDSPHAVTSPVEGDSGISLASPEKEAPLPKEIGVYGASSEPTESLVHMDAVDKQNEVVMEQYLSEIDSQPSAVPKTQDGTVNAPAVTEPSPAQETDLNTLTGSVVAANDAEKQDNSTDSINTNGPFEKQDQSLSASDTSGSVADPKSTFTVQDTPAFIELPHNLGTVPVSTGVASSIVASGSPLEESQSQFLNGIHATTLTTDVTPSVETATPTAPAALEADTVKKAVKKTNYGLTPGQSPFPDFKSPSANACREVNGLLTKAHGEVIAPKTIPQPSLTVTGCGEVPSVLDALIRTLLSGATTGSNSARAFNGLVQRFGTLTEGIGKGSVNWDAVRQAPLHDVYKAIESGGLADIKSKNLKALLDQVYEENQERKNRHITDDSCATDNEKPGMSSDEAKEAEQVKEYDIASANEHFLNLQYIHKYKTSKALKALIRYPGIGPKTAACVILFCLQRPCFAVDTHIFRICKWLGWVPEKANEITAFSHLDVKIPDELKYSLHQLFIKHGKECPRCRAITSPTSADWDKGCVIEHLVKRTGRKKVVPPSRKHVPAGSAKRVSKTTKTVTKKATQGKRVSRVTAKTSRKTARVTRATKKSADNETDAVEIPPTESAEEPKEIQSPVDEAQDPAGPKSLKRKRNDSKPQVLQKKQRTRATKKGSRAATSKATLKKTKKVPATRKPTRKPKAAKPATPGTRSSQRLKQDKGRGS